MTDSPIWDAVRQDDGRWFVERRQGWYCRLPIKRIEGEPDSTVEERARSLAACLNRVYAV